jgi:hypothetical protein
MRQMPKVSRDSAAHVDDFGPAEDRHEDLAGYTTSFTTIRQGADLAPMLKGLPDADVSARTGAMSSKGG